MLREPLSSEASTLARPLLPPDGLFGFTPCSSSRLSSASRWRGAGAAATFFCFFSVGAAGFSMSIVGSVAVAGSLTTFTFFSGALFLRSCSSRRPRSRVAATLS